MTTQVKKPQTYNKTLFLRNRVLNNLPVIGITFQKNSKDVLNPTTNVTEKKDVFYVQLNVKPIILNRTVNSFWLTNKNIIPSIHVVDEVEIEKVLKSLNFFADFKNSPSFKDGGEYSLIERWKKFKQGQELFIEKNIVKGYIDLETDKKFLKINVLNTTQLYEFIENGHVEFDYPVIDIESDIKIASNSINNYDVDVKKSKNPNYESFINDKGERETVAVDLRSAAKLSFNLKKFKGLSSSTLWNTSKNYRRYLYEFCNIESNDISISYNNGKIQIVNPKERGNILIHNSSFVSNHISPIFYKSFKYSNSESLNITNVYVVYNLINTLTSLIKENNLTLIKDQFIKDFHFLKEKGETNKTEEEFINDSLTELKELLVKKVGSFENPNFNYVFTNETIKTKDEKTKDEKELNEITFYIKKLCRFKGLEVLTFTSMTFDIKAKYSLMITGSKNHGEEKERYFNDFHYNFPLKRFMLPVKNGVYLPRVYKLEKNTQVSEISGKTIIIDKNIQTSTRPTGGVVRNGWSKDAVLNYFVLKLDDPNVELPTLLTSLIPLKVVERQVNEGVYEDVVLTEQEIKERLDLEVKKLAFLQKHRNEFRDLVISFDPTHEKINPNVVQSKFIKSVYVKIFDPEYKPEFKGTYTPSQAAILDEDVFEDDEDDFELPTVNVNNNVSNPTIGEDVPFNDFEDEVTDADLM